MKLVKLVEAVKTNVEKILPEVECLTPAVFVVTSDGIAAFSLNETPKALWNPILSATLKVLKAKAYVFVSEAWETHIETKETIEKLQSGEIKINELPPDDRQDIVWIILVEKRKRIKAWSGHLADISRNISKWEEIPKGECKGRIIVDKW